MYDLERYDHASLFLNAAPIPCNHRAHVPLAKKVLYLCYIVQNVASVEQMFLIGMFDRKVTVKVV